MCVCPCAYVRVVVVKASQRCVPHVQDVNSDDDGDRWLGGEGLGASMVAGDWV